MSLQNLDPAILQCLRQAFGAYSADVSDVFLLGKYVEQRDRFAFELLVRRHFSSVHRVCRSVLHDHHAAEDATQAVFMIFARKAESVQNRAAVVGWLVQTAYRVAKQADRKLSRSRKRLSSLEYGEVAEAREAKDLETEAILHRAIARLSEKHRDPILLCYFEGLTHAEAADRLGWPVGTLKTRLERAKEILQTDIARQGVTIPAVGLVGLLVKSEVAASPMRIGEIIDAAYAFGAGQCATGGFSACLASASIRNTLLRKVEWALVLSTAASLAAFASIAWQKENPAVPDVSPIALSQNVLAPAPKSRIDASVIAEFAKSGALYGGFVESPFSLGRSFESGDEAAERGVPGFLWNTPPKDSEKLPVLDVPVGLEFRNGRHEDLVALEKFRKLDTLVLSGKFTDESAEFIANRFRKLRCLVINRTEMTPKCVERLTPIDTLEHLTLDMALRPPVKGVPQPGGRQRRFVPPPCSDDDMASLTKFKNLKSLHLRPTLLTVAVAGYVARISSLEAFGIESAIPHTPSVIEVMKEMKHLRRIEVIDMPIDFTEALTNSDDLESIAITGKHRAVSDQKLAALAAKPRLQSLKLHINDFNDDNFTPVSTIAKLKHLDIATDERITGDCIRDLAKLKSLESLSLASNNWDKKSTGLLGTLAPTIRSLSIVSYRFTDDDLVGLTQFKEIRALKVRGSLTDRCSVTLPMFEKLERLELDRGATPCFTDVIVEGVSGIANLRHLDLGNTWITNQGVEKLVANKKLDSLILHSERIGEASIDSLAQLPSLRSLTVSESYFKQHGSKLSERLPRCVIATTDESGSPHSD